MQGYTVTQVSRLAGVSVRTLHHYDAIGLLKPARVTGAGYRLYDDAALRRLQSILLLRELEFPLAQIGQMLDSPGFDQREALGQQIHLLQLQLAHTQRLIELAKRLQQGGTSQMNTDFTAFDKAEQRQYAEEARRRWGGTAAWQEYEARQKAAGQPAGTAEDAAPIMEHFRSFGRLLAAGCPPEDEEALRTAAALQQCITDHYYTCTDEILRGLGGQYLADQRMRASIDATGGEGTAAFAAKAIEAYCAQRAEG